jgi:hypothetical protein
MGRAGLAVVEIKVGGEIDVSRLNRLVRDDEMLIGYPDGVKHPDSDVQNSTLAEWLHNGTARIPARPFLYQGIESAFDEIRKAIKEYHEIRMTGKEGNLAKIGAIAIGAVQRFVRGGYYQERMPNAPSTIRRKSRTGHSDKPLIDTGFLINSTTFVTRNLKKLPDSRQKMRVNP